LRNYINLNGEWNFELLEELPENVALIQPSKKIKVPSCVESFFPEVTKKQFYIYYSRNFSINRQKGKRYFLIFGAVDYYTTVFLNGQIIGEHEGGYSSFEFEITDFIKEDNHVQIVVFDPVDNSKINFGEIPHGKQNGEPNWYTNITGIWQGVRIEERPLAFLKNVIIKASYLKKKIECSYDVSGEIDNVNLTIKKDEKRVLKKKFAKDEKILAFLENAVAWSPENPQLYDLYLEAKNGSQTDVIHKKIGFRDFEVNNEKLLLNGDDFYMIGVLDQDFYPDTLYTIPSKEYLRSSFLKLKKMGINTLRCHVKVPDPVYMELADEIGFIVWLDAPYFDNFSEYSTKRLEKTILKTLERDISHPSLCIYSIINESWGINLDIQAHRKWLESFFHKIKDIYPDLILLDNSPCMGNYHLISDINDYHFYASAVDREEIWNFFIDDFADNPQNKFYKGYERNAENLPLLISEFGNWSLPSLKWLKKNEDEFWMNKKFSGTNFTVAKGAYRRFLNSEISEEFTLKEFVDISTAFQLENLKIEINKIKEKSSIKGYIITEFADTFWECNGLLDFDRNYKYDPEVIKKINITSNTAKIKQSNVFDGETVEICIDNINNLENVDFKIDDEKIDKQKHGKEVKENNSLRVSFETNNIGEGYHSFSLESYEHKINVPFIVARKQEHNILVTEDAESISIDEINAGEKIVLLINKIGKVLKFNSYNAKIVEKDGILSGDWISGFPWISKEFSKYFPDNTFLRIHSKLIKAAPLLESTGYSRRLSGITFGWFHGFYGYLDQLNIGKGKLFITTFNLLEDEALSTAVLEILRKL
jgi:hypothetical protein